MKCKACGKEMADDEGRQVAQWVFCVPCFEKLLEHPQESRSVEAAPESESGEEPEETSKPLGEKAHCHLCQTPLNPGEGWQLGPWLFCMNCRRDLVMLPTETEPEPISAEELEPSASSEAERAERIPIVFRTQVSLEKTVQCDRCGRRIQERGGKRFESELLCPDCYYAIPVSRPSEPTAGEPTTATGDRSQPEEIGVPSAGECDSCGKSQPMDRLETIGGFRLCRACLSTDEDMAIEIARARHRKRLEELKARFGS